MPRVQPASRSNDADFAIQLLRARLSVLAASVITFDMEPIASCENVCNASLEEVLPNRDFMISGKMLRRLDQPGND